ncbi:MAG TPA: hypothetical protein VMY69_08580 [Phycisphaerae bacterium]|nr:hypothetical protein [Phycisphaerae bacterium]
MIGRSKYSTKQAADALGCCRSNTSRKLEAIARRMNRAVLAEPKRWARSGRPDRVARALTEWVTAAGKLAAAQPETFNQWVRDMLAAAPD